VCVCRSSAQRGSVEPVGLQSCEQRGYACMLLYVHIRRRSTRACTRTQARGATPRAIKFCHVSQTQTPHGSLPAPPFLLPPPLRIAHTLLRNVRRPPRRPRPPCIATYTLHITPHRVNPSLTDLSEYSSLLLLLAAKVL